VGGKVRPARNEEEMCASFDEAAGDGRLPQSAAEDHSAALDEVTQLCSRRLLEAAASLPAM